MTQTEKKSYFTYIIFFIIFLITLFFGLKPKGYRFINQVHQRRGTIAFTNIGMIYSKATLGEIGITDSIVLRLFLKPYRTGKRLSRIVSIINEQGNELFTVDQWMKGIEITLWNENGIRIKRGGIDNALSADSFRTILIGINSREMSVTIKGITIASDKRVVHPTLGFLKNGRIIMGIANDGQNPWQGEIKELTVSGGTEKGFEGVGVSAHILFDSLTNRTIPDRSGNKWDLTVPRIPKMFRLKILVIIPDLQNIDQNLIIDMIVNFFGFIPFGSTCYLLLISLRPSKKRAIYIASISGLAISLGIEIWQVLIPTRSSQLIDVLLNGLGTLAGAVLMKKLKVSSLIKRIFNLI